MVPWRHTLLPKESFRLCSCFLPMTYLMVQLKADDRGSFSPCCELSTVLSLENPCWDLIPNMKVLESVAINKWHPFWFNKLLQEPVPYTKAVLPVFFFKFTLVLVMSMYIYLCVGMWIWIQAFEEARSLGASYRQFPGGCESPDVGVGAKLWSFERATHTLSFWAISPALSFMLYLICTHLIALPFTAM